MFTKPVRRSRNQHSPKSKVANPRCGRPGLASQSGRSSHLAWPAGPPARSASAYHKPSTDFTMTNPPAQRLCWRSRRRPEGALAATRGRFTGVDAEKNGRIKKRGLGGLRDRQGFGRSGMRFAFMAERWADPRGSPASASDAAFRCQGGDRVHSFGAAQHLEWAAHSRYSRQSPEWPACLGTVLACSAQRSSLVPVFVL